MHWPQHGPFCKRLAIENQPYRTDEYPIRKDTEALIIVPPQLLSNSARAAGPILHNRKGFLT